VTVVKGWAAWLFLRALLAVSDLFDRLVPK
jgi:hypothetical protein